jgi:hypothetical protein
MKWKFLYQITAASRTLTSGLLHPDPRSLCPLSWTEFVEPSEKKNPGYATAGRHRKKSYGNIRRDTLCPVRDLNPWPPESNSNPTYSKAKLGSCVALSGTYPSCITNYTFQDLLHTTDVYAAICIFFLELVLTWQIWTCFWQVSHYWTTHKILNQKMGSGLHKINTRVMNTWLTHYKKKIN